MHLHAHRFIFFLALPLHCIRPERRELLKHGVTISDGIHQLIRRAAEQPTIMDQIRAALAEERENRKEG